VLASVAIAGAVFQTFLPADPRIVIRPMFGHTAAFVNGHMFAGTFGPEVFVRLDEPSRADLLAMAGAKPFEPMKGRPMRGYVQLPEALRGRRSSSTLFARANETLVTRHLLTRCSLQAQFRH
jgi:TfoX/Sxy family transcriptional regulator of competence genes